MSRHREYRITCDGDDCHVGHDDYAAEVGMCMFRNEAEEQARMAGWTIGKRDLCPGCKGGPN